MKMTDDVYRLRFGSSGRVQSVGLSVVVSSRSGLTWFRVVCVVSCFLLFPCSASCINVFLLAILQTFSSPSPRQHTTPARRSCVPCVVASLPFSYSCLASSSYFFFLSCLLTSCMWTSTPGVRTQLLMLIAPLSFFFLASLTRSTVASLVQSVPSSFTTRHDPRILRNVSVLSANPLRRL